MLPRSVDASLWPEGLAKAIEPLWDESHGERQSEFVVLGVHLDRDKVEATLRECLLTDEEAAVSVDAWATAWPDPWPWSAT